MAYAGAAKASRKTKNPRQHWARGGFLYVAGLLETIGGLEPPTPAL